MTAHAHSSNNLVKLTRSAAAFAAVAGVAVDVAAQRKVLLSGSDEAGHSARELQSALEHEGGKPNQIPTTKKSL